jgi:uncharacterized protein YcnI
MTAIQIKMQIIIHIFILRINNSHSTVDKAETSLGSFGTIRMRIPKQAAHANVFSSIILSF